MLSDSLPTKYLQQSVHQDSVTVASEFGGGKRSPCLMHVELQCGMMEFFQRWRVAVVVQ